MASILGWFATPSFSEPCFVRTLCYDPLSWVALHAMAHSFIELFKPLCYKKAVIHEGELKIKYHPLLDYRESKGISEKHIPLFLQ